MIKTSTQSTKALPTDMISSSEIVDQFGEDELSFYNSIKKDLTKLEVSPRTSILDKILKYSRSV
jgi:hypothetical protein